MTYVSMQILQDRFHLPAALARDISNDCTQQALRQHWQPWAWLACWLLLTALAIWLGWLPPLLSLFHNGGVLPLMIVAATGWICLARWLSGPAMLVAAAAKAQRLGIEIK